MSTTRRDSTVEHARTHTHARTLTPQVQGRGRDTDTQIHTHTHTRTYRQVVVFDGNGIQTVFTISEPHPSPLLQSVGNSQQFSGSRLNLGAKRVKTTITCDLPRAITLHVAHHVSPRMTSGSNRKFHEHVTLTCLTSFQDHTNNTTGLSDGSWPLEHTTDPGRNLSRWIVVEQDVCDALSTKFPHWAVLVIGSQTYGVSR